MSPRKFFYLREVSRHLTTENVIYALSIRNIQRLMDRGIDCFTAESGHFKENQELFPGK